VWLALPLGRNSSSARLPAVHSRGGLPRYRQRGHAPRTRSRRDREDAALLLPPRGVHRVPPLRRRHARRARALPLRQLRVARLLLRLTAPVRSAPRGLGAPLPSCSRDTRATSRPPRRTARRQGRCWPSTAGKAIQGRRQDQRLPRNGATRSMPSRVNGEGRGFRRVGVATARSPGTRRTKPVADARVP